MDTKQPCYQHRSVCNYCQQSLGYTALRRHRDLPHLYCPGYIKTAKKPRLDSSDSDSSDSTFVPDGPSPQAALSLKSCTEENLHKSPPPSTNDLQESDDSESGPEVWDDASDYSSENESDAIEVYQSVKPLLNMVCLFLNFVIVSQTEPCHISYFSQQF